MSYARQNTAWITGPRVKSTQMTTLRALPQALNRAVPASIAANVNVTDLQQQYGAGRKVALVVLTGTFNSLPPDEGIVAYGAMVAIVDARSHQVLLLMD